MRSFPSEKTLVTAYWRKLASPNGAKYKSRIRVVRDATLPRTFSGVGAARRPYRLRPRTQFHSNP